MKQKNKPLHEYTDNQLVEELQQRGNYVNISPLYVRSLPDKTLFELQWDINPITYAHWRFDEQQYDAIHKMVSPCEVIYEIKRRGIVRRNDDGTFEYSKKKK